MKVVKEGMGPSELFRFLVALFLRDLAAGEGGACQGVMPLNAECVLTAQAFEVPGTNPFVRSKKYLLFFRSHFPLPWSQSCKEVEL